MRHRFYVLCFIYVCFYSLWTTEHSSHAEWKGCLKVWTVVNSEEKKPEKSIGIMPFYMRSNFVDHENYIHLRSLSIQSFNHSIKSRDVFPTHYQLLSFFFCVRAEFSRPYFLSASLYIQYACADVTIVVTDICYHWRRTRTRPWVSHCSNFELGFVRPETKRHRWEKKSRKTSEKTTL